RLAETVSEMLEGGEIIDAEEFAKHNEEFHEYLFILSDNPMFLESFRRLNVHNQMVEALRNGAWIAPEIDEEHFGLVEAFETDDLGRAKSIIHAHNEHARQTMSEVVN